MTAALMALRLRLPNPRRAWAAFWLQRAIAHNDRLEADLADQLSFQIASLTAQAAEARSKAAAARHDLAALLRGHN